MTEIFCIIDDFCKALPKDFEKQLGAGNTTKVRQRSGKLSLSEMMTILILFQSSVHRNYKGYYLDYICRHCNSEFPGLISYSRFVYLMPRVLPALSLLMLKMCGETNGIAFVDSTTLTVCHNKRVKRNRVVTTQGQVFERPLLLGEGDFGSPKSGEGFPLRGQVWPSQESILQSNQDVFTILSHS
jgi:hypothetical protein